MDSWISCTRSRRKVRERKPDFRGKTVLVTGGTKGIGRAVGLAFGARGADCVLTHKWGSADLDELKAAYASIEAPCPQVIQADVSSDEDTDALFDQLASRGVSLDVIVSNVSFSFATRSLHDYRRRSLLKSLEYSAWPVVSYVMHAARRLGKTPRYVIGISSPGPDAFHTGYDFAAASKSVMEVFCRYMGHRLGVDTRFNVVRPGGVFTDSLESTFGSDFRQFAGRLSDPTHYLTGEDVGSVVVALASGWMDGVGGQVIHIDRGTPFFDCAMRLFDQRERYGI